MPCDAKVTKDRGVARVLSGLNLSGAVGTEQRVLLVLHVASGFHDVLTVFPHFT